MLSQLAEHDHLVRSNSAPAIQPIQFLRAIAALMVVWHHAREQLTNLKYLFPSESGNSGVDLFFVISGFIMVVTTSKKQVSARNFLLRRIVRVVPLYWLLTLSVVTLAMLAPQLLRSTDISASHVIQSLLFIPHMSPTHLGTAWPVLVPGWTLNYEMYFYAVFACTLLLNLRYRFAALTVLLGSLVLAGLILGSLRGPVVATYTSLLLLEFLVGAVLGRLWVADRVIRSAWGSALSLVVGFALLLWREAPHAPLAQILGSGLVVAGALSPSFREWRNRPMLALGDASYSIYLTHLFALGLLRWVWTRLDISQLGFAYSWLFMLAALVFASVVGWLVHWWVEQPLTAWLTGRLFQPTPRALTYVAGSVSRLP
jgi:exopolysaccharide production protein ExoZ